MGPAATRYVAHRLAELVSAEQRLMWLAVLIRLEVFSRHDLVQIRNATLALLPPQQHGIGEAVA
jgi:hypothetical protein